MNRSVGNSLQCAYLRETAIYAGMLSTALPCNGMLTSC
jgi:hypothetical protein